MLADYAHSFENELIESVNLPRNYFPVRVIVFSLSSTNSTQTLDSVIKEYS